MKLDLLYLNFQIITLCTSNNQNNWHLAPKIIRGKKKKNRHIVNCFDHLEVKCPFLKIGQHESIFAISRKCSWKANNSNFLFMLWLDQIAYPHILACWVVWFSKKEKKKGLLSCQKVKYIRIFMIFFFFWVEKKNIYELKVS